MAAGGGAGGWRLRKVGRRWGSTHTRGERRLRAREEEKGGEKKWGGGVDGYRV